MTRVRKNLLIGLMAGPVAGLGTMLALGMIEPARAGFNEGQAAYQRGDLAAALREFLPPARSGNTLAQLRLAEIYFNGGPGLDRDIPRGMEWLRKAAAAGNPAAVFFLGRVLAEGGLGQAPDLAEGVRLLEIAAKGGNVQAMGLLAPIYLTGGSEVPKNEARAVALYRAVAERGNGAAWRVLAQLAEEGVGGLPRDSATIADYLTRAAALGDVPAHLLLGQMVLRGDGVPADPARGAQLIRLAAEAGDYSAMLVLAELYRSGVAGLAGGDAAALKWLTVVLNRAPQGPGYFQASLAAQDLRNRLSAAAIERAEEDAAHWQPQSLKPVALPSGSPGGQR